MTEAREQPQLLDASLTAERGIGEQAERQATAAA
jgi:hypothetical protein